MYLGIELSVIKFFSKKIKHEWDLKWTNVSLLTDYYLPWSNYMNVYTWFKISMKL